MKRFDGAVVLITGATSGIGRSAAIAWAKEGARLVLAGRRQAEGEATLQMVREAGGEGVFLRADVSRESDIERLVGTALDRYGRLDCALNNAGVEGRAGLVTEQDEANFDHVFSINVKGCFFAMKHEIAAMQLTGGGAIVNNASVGGLVGMPGMSIYSASKHAVCGLTRSIALEWASKGIRLNAIAPGGVETEMFQRANGGPASEARRRVERWHPMGRIAQPDEIVGLILWLCSAEASFVTGQVWAIDGGFTAR
jgi:NAD(P)-dependent dehydrogenase (short-subunit alcohol dehydrogenase family)